MPSKRHVFEKIIYVQARSTDKPVNNETDFYFWNTTIPAIIKATPINLLHSKHTFSVPNSPKASIKHETTSCAIRISIVAYAGPKPDMLFITVNVINAPITPLNK